MDKQFDSVEDFIEQYPEHAYKIRIAKLIKNLPYSSTYEVSVSNRKINTISTILIGVYYRMIAEGKAEYLEKEYNLDADFIEALQKVTCLNSSSIMVKTEMEMYKFPEKITDRSPCAGAVDSIRNKICNYVSAILELCESDTELMKYIIKILEA